MFDPEPGDVVELLLGGQNIRFKVDSYTQSHMSFMAYSSEGAKAIVYRLMRLPALDRYALKKFKKQFQDPELEGICAHLDSLKTVPGLLCCERFCLTKSSAGPLLAEYPDLEYAIIMPWISGQTWFDVRATEGDPYSKWQDPALCLMIAARLAERVADLERRGISHCDLSPGNVIFDPLNYDVQFIDVEDLCAPGLTRPNEVTSGSPGYQHCEATGGLWCPEGDRFAAAILIAEMVTFCDPQVRSDKHGPDSYFDPKETTSCDPYNQRYRTMRDALARLQPALAPLFQQAWLAQTLSECPMISEWSSALISQRPPLPLLPDFKPFWIRLQWDTKPVFNAWVTVGIGEAPKAKGFTPLP